MNASSKNNTGFTLIELLVVIAIISFLSSVVMASLSSAKVKALDGRRKQDMEQIRTALELYYSDHKAYPLASPGWWGGASAGGCGPGNSTSYIAGLAPKYIAVLPLDPANPDPSSCSGYLYGSDGVHYKLLAHLTPSTYPNAGSLFYDPVRPTWSWMLCSDEPACSSW